MYSHLRCRRGLRGQVPVHRVSVWGGALQPGAKLLPEGCVLSPLGPLARMGPGEGAARCLSSDLVMPQGPAAVGGGSP